MDPGSWNVDPGSGILDLGHIIILFEIIHHYTTKLPLYAPICPQPQQAAHGCRVAALHDHHCNTVLGVA